ncbi:MAG: serine dehydratase beta chain, partial [Psychroflexus salarius]
MKKIECISVFDMLKIGVGPSSSHTLGPWRASQRFIEELKSDKVLNQVEALQVNLYGSLSLTGKGHASDIASVLGLCGFDPVTMDTSIINQEIESIKKSHQLYLDKTQTISFNFDEDIKFHKRFLDFHPNGITYEARLKNGNLISSSFYSIGGGFVVKE